MKKLMVLILGLVLILSAACAEEPNLETLAALDWEFCSGAGGWSTDLHIKADGSFAGTFHDSEMGDCTDEYPDGTVYFCAFSGRMSLTGRVDEHAWKVHIDELNVQAAKETIADGIRYIPAEPYGISEGDDMLLYRPGTPVSLFSEDMLFWTHVMEQEDTPVELDNWFLSSKKNESGFVGYQYVSMPDPWEDMTAEQLEEVSGLSFGVPADAENVLYRYLQSENLAEMQFTRAGDEYCARIRPMTLKEDELYDISGMYYEWKVEEPVTIGQCFGCISQSMQDGESQVERCLWYDADSGRMYSLSVIAADTDGLDLTALAEQVYSPAQGNE